MDDIRASKSSDRILRDHFESCGYSQRVVEGGTEYLLRRWNQVVDKIETGQPISPFEEYLNAIDVRQIISEALAILPESEKLTFDAAVQDIDHRFIRATKVTEDCIWGQTVATQRNYKPELNWWYYRIPN